MLGNRAGEETGASQHWEIAPTATAVLPDNKGDISQHWDALPAKKVVFPKIGTHITFVAQPFPPVGNTKVNKNKFPIKENI